MEKQCEADVVIIGGGIAGTAIARELSRYKVETILVEKGGDLANGQTKCGTASLYTGLVMVGSLITKSVILPPGAPIYDPNTFKMNWIEVGVKEWPKVLDELGVKYSRLPVLVFARNDEELQGLKRYEEVAHRMGGEYAECYRKLNKEEIFALEPNVNKDVFAGLYDENHLLDVFPPEIAIAMAENATQNGAKILLDAEVTGVIHNGGYQIVETRQGSIKTNFIINCAGGNADKIAQMSGACDFDLILKTSQLVVFDRRKGDLVNGMVRCPCVPGFLCFLKKNCHDNPFGVCSSYGTVDSPDDTESVYENTIETINGIHDLVPGISQRDVINYWTGVRAFSNKNPDDYLVEFSPRNPRFINIVLRAPGVAGSLFMSKHVVGMLADAGLKLTSKSDFNPRRKGIPRFRDLSDEERDELINQDSRYGHVICRCETVTEGEIVEAIRRGARTEQGVKLRTRAGMGRCKRGFCGPRVIAILARELDIPVTEVTKRGRGSMLLPYKSKELLQAKEEVGV